MPETLCLCPRAALDFRSVPEIRMTSEDKQPPARRRRPDSGLWPCVCPSFSRAIAGQPGYIAVYLFGGSTPFAFTRTARSFLRAGGDHVSLPRLPSARANNNPAITLHRGGCRVAVDVPVVSACLVLAWTAATHIVWSETWKKLWHAVRLYACTALSWRCRPPCPSWGGAPGGSTLARRPAKPALLALLRIPRLPGRVLVFYC